MDKLPPLHHQEPSSVFSLTSYLIVAAALHTILFSILHFYRPPLEIEKEKTVSIVVLNRSQPENKTEQTMQNQSRQQSGKEKVTTTGFSDFSIDSATSAAMTTITPTKSNAEQVNTSRNTQTHHRNSPSFSTPSRTQQKQNSSANQGWQSVFKSTEQNTSTEVTQISTKDASILSDFEQALRKKLLNAELYDDFHSILTQTSAPEVGYDLSIRLYQNGAIRSASLSKSSGIEAIDKLAIQTAYRASPYPKPPKKDQARGYRYEIPIIYDAKGVRLDNDK